MTKYGAFLQVGVLARYFNSVGLASLLLLHHGLPSNPTSPRAARASSACPLHCPH